jgi:drug/metabolite transporter (DMT)-like permease
MKTRYLSVGQALTAALLFGLSVPFSKIFLQDINPIVLSSLLYLGSGAGLLILKVISTFHNKEKVNEASLKINDFKWLSGAILTGGVAAPIILLISLKATPASTASLLLNFESIATTIIALLIFGESAGRRVWIAIIFITIASTLLTIETKGDWGISLGSIGVLFACVLWGLDNNLTRNISSKDPITIVLIKGLAAGGVSFFIALFTGANFPGIKFVIESIIIGFFCYGLSIVLFIRSLRSLGASKTGAYFSIAPFIGVVLSFLIFKESPNLFFVIALPLIILGVILLTFEKHFHKHEHKEIIHEHRHSHDDGHHNHVHDFPGFTPSLVHSHIHKHEDIIHSHEHTPDIHHRHSHL